MANVACCLRWRQRGILCAPLHLASGWRGEPGARATEVGGVGWIRAIDWIPYQRRTFVTPAFPGYVSGHSTFSRAAAEVLTLMTGSAFFPGGLLESTFAANRYLGFERGPSADVGSSVPVIASACPFV